MKNKGRMTRRDSSAKMGYFAYCKKVKFKTGLEGGPWYVGTYVGDSAEGTGALLVATLQIRRFSL